MSTQGTFQKVNGHQPFESKTLRNGTKTITLDPNKSIQEQINNLDLNTIFSDTPNVDTQVKVKKQRAPRRKFSNTYKLQILNALDACKNANERGALLRKEGVYYARVSAWKKQFQNGKFVGNKTTKSVLLTQQLTREVISLKKKLLQRDAIIDLQKKVSELLSINILDHDVSEMSS